jgi:hypothetical protein
MKGQTIRLQHASSPQAKRLPALFQRSGFCPTRTTPPPLIM